MREEIFKRVRKPHTNVQIRAHGYKLLLCTLWAITLSHVRRYIYTKNSHEFDTYNVYVCIYTYKYYILMSNVVGFVHSEMKLQEVEGVILITVYSKRLKYSGYV